MVVVVVAYRWLTMGTIATAEGRAAGVAMAVVAERE